MGVYAILATLTEAGARDLVGIAQRRDENIRHLEQNGVKVIADYALMGGDFDFLYIVEAANDETIMRQVIHDTQGGLLKFRTLPAVPLESFAQYMIDRQMVRGG